MSDRDKLELELDAYLNKYLSRRWIKMKDVLRGMKTDLSREGYVSAKSFRSVLGLLRKEVRFISLNDKQITNYFSPLFEPPSNTSGSLEPFLSGTLKP
jgi:hypothetical protein